ncbi:MAG: gamma-glutamyl-phosphate reductase, partial [Pygmaiobacter sp.]
MSIQPLLEAATAAKSELAAASCERKNALLAAMGASLRCNEALILAANQRDIEAAQQTISEVMIDRLRLTPERITAMAAGMQEVALLPDPIGNVQRSITRPNGLSIEKVSVPFGVIAIIYESRPNVTADAAALCVKAGSVCVLRGGKEAIHSNCAIVEALKAGARQ